MIGLVAILAALAALMALAYRGWSVIVLAPLLSAALLGAVGQPVLAGYTQVFMPAVGGFIVAFFPLFLLGAIFGRLMEVSGAAASLAGALTRALGPGRAVAATVLCCAVMTYGGVSLFVVAFAVYPVAAALFRADGVSPLLIPGALALGSFTFTMTALPGTPAIQNAIPMPYFDTNLYAAPGLGLISAAIMAGLGMVWLQRRAVALGPVATEPAAPEAEGAGPSPLLAALPLAAVLAVNLLMTFVALPRLDAGYLADPAYGATTLGAVQGLWAIITALTAACVLTAALNARRLGDGLAATLQQGATASLAPVFNTASLVGFGSIVAAMPAFDLIREAATGLGGDNPLISLAIATNLLAGVTGSASGGMSIALAALGADYLAQAQAMDLDPAALHRIVAVATGGLDALPHNGAVVTLLTICGLTHRQAYGDIAVVAMAIPILSLAVIVALASAFGAF